MFDLPSPEPSPQAGGSTPPPLPRKVRLFKLGWRLGFWFGTLQTIFLLLALVLFFFTPGGPPPLGMFAAAAGAALQAFSAHFISKRPTDGRSLFTIASVSVSFCYLTGGLFFFAILNLVPLLLLVASSSPDVATKVAEPDYLKTSDAPSPESSPAKEDLY
jgi:hypothetical protein